MVDAAMHTGGGNRLALAGTVQPGEFVDEWQDKRCFMIAS
jgi:hypothetical protein